MSRIIINIRVAGQNSEVTLDVPSTQALAFQDGEEVDAELPLFASGVSGYEDPTIKLEARIK